MSGGSLDRLLPVADGLRRGGDLLRELFWPRRCAGCGYRGVWICEECLARDPMWRRPWCMRCGVPRKLGCRCRGLAAEVDAARSLGAHDGWLQTAVHLFKFSQETERCEQFGPPLAIAVSDLPSIDLIVPVPLHRKRLNERGYNQSELLACALSEETGVPVAPTEAFARILDTPHQTGLSAEERRRNLAGAFVVTRPDLVASGHMVLVDDVLTTGATARECAWALKRAGAGRVSVATVTRALPDSDRARSQSAR